ncbi:DExH-box ATP-dependent RNA helicase DExH6 [Lycium barbarum]|uniref:DExH-box ATP-dependent RNA helicase DExH6 n=1 Tax=Lycium barbarum TaxID=112863 RepID=UPI00293E4795|nr:DExH-box ATP-dependent RNA helicase DExH6 [Lycium barbarum]XP_060186852.1 DExH-box ATP-dependent RNA helicase DExH6 [Lycium barbarum]
MASTTSSSGFGKKRQKKGQRQQEVTNVAESTRIRVAQVLEQFRASNDQVYTFESNLSNRDRAAVHMLCRKMGMKSKSSGRGDQRRISIFKTKNNVDTLKGKDALSGFKFLEEAKDVLQDLFTRYPPDDGETSEQVVGKQSKKVDKLRGKKDDMFSKPAMNKSEIAKRVESLASRIENNPNLRQITAQRSKLPIASFKDVITSTVESNQVVLISGETGCGKTTQVPQYILDHMWGKGETCKIVCTQPRRISATSVSERISAERGESVGDTVGYKIRLESRGGRQSSIMFCTNGVLLRVLVTSGSARFNKEAPRKMGTDDISDITHIIVDEIHERDRYSDFMLAILRDLLPSYPNLRLVLMSATLDAERFSKYFGGCPVIRVPGFTYPVNTFYLEDVLSIVKSTENNHLDSTSTSIMSEESLLTEEYKVALDEAINLALSDDDLDPLLDLISSDGGQKVFNYQHSLNGVTPLMVFAGKGCVRDICMLLSFGADCHLCANDGKNALDWAERENQTEAAELIKKHMEKLSSSCEEQQHLLDKYLSTVDPELIDDVLIEQLLRKICIDSEVDGAILVFLPGWEDINRTRERLKASHYFNDPSKFSVIALHSMVPSVEQKKVFRRPPPGCRKIVLSTNIAETAITIDDVVYVIDSGRMKEKSYDPYNNVSTLQSSWVSKASAKQREGRAGRCQPGICYHLYSKLRAASLPDFQVPEIKRIPIEELCLQVKLLNPDCKIEEFLQKTLDPPVYETIRNAIIVLQNIGALSIDEKLTELGERLGSLPVHPLTSKMLFIAILLNCLDPALTLACASDYRDPFTLPMLPNEKKKAAAAKAELASWYGGRSDQLAVVAAFEGWKSAKENGQESRFCSMYFVSSSTMHMLSGMRRQLQSELLRHGFIPGDGSSCSLNSQDPGILHAVLVAGLYPMVGRLLPPLKGGKRAVLETAGGDKVRLHPHSTNFKLSFKKFFDRPLIVYDEITRGDGGLHIRNCSVIGPLPLLLLATEIVVAPGNEDDDDDNDDGESDYEDADEDNGEEDNIKADPSDADQGEKIMSSPDNTVKVIVDRWIPFESTALDVAQIYCLRERLAKAILFKVTHPGKVLPEVLAASIYAMACILSYNGMSGISLPLESVDSLTTMVSATEIGQSDPGWNSGMYMNPNNSPSSFGHNSRHQRPYMHHQRGGIHVSKGSFVYGGTGQRGHYKRQRGN